MLEEIYSRIWYIRKRKELRKYKRSSSRFWEISIKTEESEDSRRARLQKKKTTNKIYSKNTVWVRWWKIWKKVLKKVRKKLLEMKVYFLEKKS